MLKFATWNIACGAKGYHGKGIPDIAKWIVEQEIDVCVLQEVDRFAERSGYIDIPSFFEKETGLQGCFFKSYALPPARENGPENEYGNFILSRFPIKQASCIPLFPVDIPETAHMWEGEQRTAIIARLDLKGKELVVMTTHLAYSLDYKESDVRSQQVGILISAIKEQVKEDIPLILAGDLNIPIEARDLKPLHDYFNIHTKDIGPTSPLGAEKPAYISIDHILSRNVTVDTVQKHDMPDFSDHSVVYMEARI